MDEIAKQVAIVLQAPVPFFLVMYAILFSAGVWMYNAFEWAYRMRLDKAQFYIEMAKLDQQRAKERESDLEKELKETTEKLATVEKEKEKLTPAGQEALSEATSSVAESKVLVSQIAQANNAVATSLQSGSVSTGRAFLSEPTYSAHRDAAWWSMGGKDSEQARAIRAQIREAERSRGSEG